MQQVVTYFMGTDQARGVGAVSLLLEPYGRWESKGMKDNQVGWGFMWWLTWTEKQVWDWSWFFKEIMGVTLRVLVRFRGLEIVPEALGPSLYFYLTR